MIRCSDGLGSPLCISKERGFARKSENPPKVYVIESKVVSPFIAAMSRKIAGAKNEGNLHYVVENTCRKNVRNRALHYVDEKKSTYSRISIMLMKIKALIEKQ
jgi:hypothetical protein